MNDAEIMARLILGNVGDETALRNICEAHNQCIDELAPEEKKHMFATNSFYYSAKEFNTIHSEETDALFLELLESRNDCCYKRRIRMGKLRVDISR